MTLETLHCDNGAHGWQRQSKRGRKPRNCEAHPDFMGDVSTPDRLTESQDSEPSDLGTLLPSVQPGAERADRLIQMLRDRTRYGKADHNG